MIKKKNIKKVKSNFSITRFALTVTICLSMWFNKANALTGVGIFSQPRTVQTKQAAIEFFGQPGVTIPAGGWIKLLAPSEITIYPNAQTCTNMVDEDEECYVEIVGQEFKITTTVALEKDAQFQFSIAQAIDNPDSTKPSDTFQMSTSAGETFNKGVLTAVPGTFTELTLEPASTVVGESTSLEVKWRAEHALPKGGYIFLNFPQWNPGSSQPKNYIQGSEYCESVLQINALVQCSFKDGQLQVTEAAPSRALAAGTEIAFNIIGFKNPISTDVINGFQLYTAVKSDDTGDYYEIDRADATLQVNDYAKLVQATLEVKPDDGNPDQAGIVQQLNEMQLSFYLPVPMQQGCQVQIILPQQYSTDTIQKLYTLNAFGRYTSHSVTQNNLVIDKDTNSLHLPGCETFVENDMIASIYLDSLLQFKYAKESDSLQIFINTQSGAKIAGIESGVKFTPNAGTIDVNCTAVDQVIQAETDLKFTLEPKQSIYVTDDPVLVIQFPPDVLLVSQSCEIKNVTMTGVTQSPDAQCEFQAQTVRITEFLATDYIYSGKRQIMFTLGVIQNPASLVKSDNLDITILAFGDYKINTYSGIIPWELTAGTFNKLLVHPSSLVAYTPENIYQITFNPQHEIPKKGYVMIGFPPQIIIPDTSYSQSQCQAFQGAGFVSDQLACFFQESTDQSGYLMLGLYNAFRRGAGPANVDYTIQIPGIRNPVATHKTQTFTIASYNQNDEIVDELNSGATIKMTSSAQLGDVKVRLQSYTNSADTYYSFLLEPTVPIKATDYITFGFPQQIRLPTKIRCGSVYVNLISKTNCFLDQNKPNTIRVYFTLADDLQSLQPNDRFSIELAGIINPSSTRTSDSIEVIISDKNGNPINQKLQGVTVTTNQPSIVSKASIDVSNPEPGNEANFTVSITPEHDLLQGGGLWVQYPPQVTSTGSVTAEVKCSNSSYVIDNSKVGLVYEESARSIIVTNVIQNQTGFIAGQDGDLEITIKGLMNPFSNKLTDSFVITTLNYDGKNIYFVDTANNGLSVNSQCIYPCRTCDSTHPSQCKSCYQDLKGGLPFLQQTTCVAKCSTGRYYDTDKESCELCDSKCLDCEGSANNCTVCGVSDYLYLHDGDCRKDCPNGFIEDSGENLCAPCSEHCLTCEKSVNTCTSCNKTSQWPYLFDKECISECKPDISVLVDDQCVACDSSCKSCQDSPNKCTSCESYMAFNKQSNTCTAMCSPGTEIFVEQDGQGTCELCQEDCSKCAGSVNECTECKTDFVLNYDLTCQKTCNNVQETPVDGVCQQCEDPCKTCLGSADSCTSCFGEYLLYDTTCVQYCPEKYEQEPGTMKCILVGLVCPEGFNVNQRGDGCVPIWFDCAQGYQINDEKTACIPSPGSPVPFPFILTSVFISFFVLGSYLKDKFFTKVYTNLICLIGVLEIFMYITMFVLAIDMGEWAIMSLTLIGLLLFFAQNGAFFYYYRKQIISNDKAFKRWLHYFPKTEAFLPFLCAGINFKCIKMIYSGFYGLENTLAQFDQPGVFFRIMRMMSYFSFIFTYGAIFLADIIIFSRISWGYQLLVVGIETFLLQILIIVLTVLELKKGISLLNTGGEHYTMIKPKGGLRPTAVKGEYEEESYEDSDLPEMDENTLIRSKLDKEEIEIGYRQRALYDILTQVGNNFLNENKGGRDQFDINSKLDNCLSKYDKNYKKVTIASLSNLDERKVAEGYPPKVEVLRRAVSVGSRSDNDDQQSWSAEGECVLNAEELSDFEWEDYQERTLQRRNTFPFNSMERKEFIPNFEFKAQLNHIEQAMEDYCVDNCYAERAKRQEVIQNVQDYAISPQTKRVSRRTQTYLRDILSIEGYGLMDSDQEIVIEEEIEIAEYYTKDLINDVIDGISDADSVEKKKGPRKSRKNIKKEMRGKFKPKKEIPDFELQDIMGKFEIDDLGNYVILRGDQGELLDKLERKVNRRGYLVDRHGNVINTKGQIIFKVVELDVDDEIPAPFGFEKRKKNLAKFAEDKKFSVDHPKENKNMNIDTSNVIDDDEETVDKQFRQIRKKAQKMDKTGEPFDDAQKFNNMNVDIMEGAHASNQAEPETGRPPSVRKPKKQKKADVEHLFPRIGVQNNQEQRKLAKIADSISVMANQLAQDNLATQFLSPKIKQNEQPKLTEAEYLEKVKQDHLREILETKDENQSQTRQWHLPNQRTQANDSLVPSDQHLTSNSAVFTNSRKITSANPKANTNRMSVNQTDSRFIGRDNKNFQRVYENILDSQHDDKTIQDMIQSKLGSSINQYTKKPRMQSGTTAERRLRGLENIYLSKFNKQDKTGLSKPKKQNYFRPTANQFIDDPEDLNANTEMGGIKGRDTSVFMANQLDDLQRQYLNQPTGLGLNQQQSEYLLMQQQQQNQQNQLLFNQSQIVQGSSSRFNRSGMNAQYQYKNEPNNDFA